MPAPPSRRSGRSFAAGALGEFGNRADPARPALTECCRDREMDVRSAAALALSKVAAPVRGSVPLCSACGRPGHVSDDCAHIQVDWHYRRARGMVKRDDWSEWVLTHVERLAVVIEYKFKALPLDYLPSPTRVAGQKPTSEDSNSDDCGHTEEYASLSSFDNDLFGSDGDDDDHARGGKQ